MALKANVKEAVVSLYAAKQRSFLALIGIVIGIGSVIAMISVGAIARHQALQQFRELGTEFLAIRVHAPGSSVAARLPLSDVVALPEATSSIAAVAPWNLGHAQAFYAGKKFADASILGVTWSFVEVNRLHVERGRGISDLDFRRYYCMVGAKIASALRDVGVERLVGESIRIKERLCAIVGVLRSAPGSNVQSIDIDSSILIPFSTAQRMFSKKGVRQISARMKSDAHHTAAAAEVQSYFRSLMPGLRIEVSSAQVVIEQMGRQMQTFALLLAAIGSISLIVGGVGVMNVMLVSVTERRREIGIRRALGARRFDILTQFLTESVVLSLVGGVFGIALGVGSTWIFCRFSGWTFLVDLTAVALGFVVACCVGIFFGLQPAIQATRLDPIDALRAE